MQEVRGTAASERETNFLAGETVLFAYALMNSTLLMTDRLKSMVTGYYISNWLPLFENYISPLSIFRSCLIIHVFRIMPVFFVRGNPSGKLVNDRQIKISFSFNLSSDVA